MRHVTKEKRVKRRLTAAQEISVERLMRWLQLQFDFDSTAVRRASSCLSKVIKVSVTQPASRSLADLFIYLGRSAAARSSPKSL